MNLPWISRRHHDEVAALCGRLIADRDERIRQLESERRMLWDKICLLGIGAPAFAPAADGPEMKDAGAVPGAGASPNVSAGSSAGASGASASGTLASGGSAAVAVAPASAWAMMRPSAIMRRMDRLAEARYLRKVHPSRANEEVVTAMFDQIDREVE